MVGGIQAHPKVGPVVLWDGESGRGETDAEFRAGYTEGPERVTDERAATPVLQEVVGFDETNEVVLGDAGEGPWR